MPTGGVIAATYTIGSGTASISTGTWTLSNCPSITYTLSNSNFPASVTLAVGAGTSTDPILSVTATDAALDGAIYTLDFVGTDGNTASI